MTPMTALLIAWCLRVNHLMDTGWPTTVTFRLTVRLTSMTAHQVRHRVADRLQRRLPSQLRPDERLQLAACING